MVAAASMPASALKTAPLSGGRQQSRSSVLQVPHSDSLHVPENRGEKASEAQLPVEVSELAEEAQGWVLVSARSCTAARQGRTKGARHLAKWTP